APPGHKGSGQAAGVSFSIPRNALEYWQDRARQAAVTQLELRSRFDQTFLTIMDPDGLEVELSATAPPDRDPSIVSLNSATIVESDPGRSGKFLADVLGCALAARKDGRSRFMLMDPSNTGIDIIAAPGTERAKLSRGMVHHIAFRVADEAAQNQWRERLIAAGVHVTRVIDRQYFRSIYFREPGGVLFEIATDGPGFLIDEDADALGTSLKLPPWLEPIRESIERRLPVVEFGSQ
ncbi:MAG TPA: ring-cleaving dioxygenase, partial [Bryobacteraceae bacterium]|nr:ring-cleaving dioxygenase [Bryobacteraceae bacterium]